MEIKREFIYTYQKKTKERAHHGYLYTRWKLLLLCLEVLGLDFF